MKIDKAHQDVVVTIAPQFFEIQPEKTVTDMTSPQVIHKNDAVSLEEMMAKMPESFHNFFEVEAA